MRLPLSLGLEVPGLVLERQGEAAAEVVVVVVVELPQAPAPVQALAQPHDQFLPRSWLVGKTSNQSQRTPLLHPPGNKPLFAPLSPTPDHHPSSNFSTSSINSPSAKCISFSSEACMGRSSVLKLGEKGVRLIPRTRIRRSHTLPCLSSGHLRGLEVAEVEAEAGQSLVRVLAHLVRPFE